VSVTDDTQETSVVSHDPAPLPSPEPDTSADAGLVEAVSGGLTWIPFAIYLGTWLALAGVSGYLLSAATPEVPPRWLPAYPALVLAGLALAVIGPVLSLSVWLHARRRREPGQRRGLLASALTRGALAAFFGATIWVVTLYILEVVSSGGAW
jgi:hypothetical protein